MSRYMPGVDAVREQQDATFQLARRIATKGKVLRPGGLTERCVALVTPGRLIIPIPCPPGGTYDPDLVATLRRMVSDQEAQTISVIAFNDLSKPIPADHLESQGITAQLIDTMIPSLGLLTCMSSFGHNVVVFEGHSSALALGCQDADLLLVDEIMMAHLPQDWVSVASRALRKPRILVWGREGTITPLDAASAKGDPLRHQNVLSVDLTHLKVLIRSIGDAPLLLTMPKPESYLPKGARGIEPEPGKKLCPRCGRELNIYAVKCRFCKSEL
jgi:hypothetical protein